MNLRQSLLKEHSKKQCRKIVKFVGNDKQKFKSLMNLLYDEDSIVSQRAAWPIGFIGKDHPELVEPHLKKMLKTLEIPVHNAVRRNIVRVLENYDIPEKYLGLAANNCFTLLEDPAIAIGIKAFSMTILFNICKKEPELKNELKLIIESMLEGASPGILSRANRILPALENLN